MSILALAILGLALRVVEWIVLGVIGVCAIALIVLIIAALGSLLFGHREGEE